MNNILRFFMIIHSVRPNETIYSIAELYGVSSDMLIKHNQAVNTETLIVGQSIVILFPKKTHIVQVGDTLLEIAASHGITLMQLMRNNPHLSDRLYIYPEEELIIQFPDEKRMEISTNGYAFPFIDLDILRKTLPYLTYLTIFYYRITQEGDIVDIEDEELISLAKSYGVAPIMIISALTVDGIADIETAHSIFISADKQELLINRVLANMKKKDYFGLNIDIQNIQKEDRQLYIDFFTNISNRVRQEGYLVFLTLTPSTFQSDTGFMYQGPEYTTLGQLSDSVMLLSYEWGYTHSPMTALPLATVRALLDYSITQIPPEKINIGLPTVGYIWKLPYTDKVTIANSMSHNSALSLAREVGAVIQRDEASKAPFFSFIDDYVYVVWFRDSRNIASLLEFVPEYGLEGVGIWNIMYFATGLWLEVNSYFEIKKVL
jgi:spore germination protein